MPTPPSAPTRRRVLALGLVVPAGLLGGCGVDWGQVRRDDGAPPPAAEPDADERARRRAVRDATVLRDAAAAAAGQVAEAGAAPAAGTLLAAVGTVCAEHLGALAPGAGRSGSPTGAGTATGSPPTRTGDATGTARATATATGTATATATGTASGTATGPASPAPGSPPVPPAEVVDLLAETSTHALADALTTTPAMARLLVQVAAARAVLADRLAAALGVPPPPVPSPGAGAAATVAGPPSTTAAVPPGGPPATGPAPTTTGPPAVSTVPTPEPGSRPGSLSAALSAAVEAERAAAYAYGVLGPRLTDASRRSALVTREEHRRRAGLLVALAADVGADLPPGAPAWELPAPVATAQEAVALAVDVEQRVTAVHLDLVSASAPPLRATAAELVVATALRAAGWGGPVVPLPGTT